MFYDNRENTFLEFFKKALAESTRIGIVAGYATKGGFDLIAEELMGFLERGGSVRIVVGMPVASGITKEDLAALKAVNDLSGNDQGCRVKVSTDPIHSKVFCCECNGVFYCSVGSSNLTKGGLKRNIEYNTIVTTPVEVDECLKFFTYAWEIGSMPIDYAVPFIVERSKQVLRKRKVPVELPDNPGFIPELKAPLKNDDYVDILINESNIHWGHDRGRSPNEAILYFKAAVKTHPLGRRFFPPRDVVFDVFTDDGDEFQMKISGGNFTGDPLGKNLLSYPSNAILGAWFHQRGIQPNDILRIWRIVPHEKYYFEVFKPE